MIYFLIQGNKENEWLQPFKCQIDVIQPLYKQWQDNLGQGGMASSGTELNVEKQIGEFNYLIHINGDYSYMQNLKYKTKRSIHFLPKHDGIKN